MKSKKTGEKIAKEVVIKELQDYHYHYSYEEITEDEVQENFPKTIKAMVNGRLVFDENKKFTLKLLEEIKTEQGTVVLDEFKSERTRIKPSDNRSLMKGIDINKDSYGYMLRVYSHIVAQDQAFFDKVHPLDMKVLQELIPVFL